MRASEGMHDNCVPVTVCMMIIKSVNELLYLTVGTSVPHTALTSPPRAASLARAEVVLAKVTWLHVAGHLACWYRCHAMTVRHCPIAGVFALHLPHAHSSCISTCWMSAVFDSTSSLLEEDLPLAVAACKAIEM